MKKDKEQGEEVLSLANKQRATIEVYTCMFIDNIEYRLRRAKDNALICELDKDMNMIGELKTLVDVEQFEKAMEAVRIQKKAFDYADSILGPRPSKSKED